MPNLRHRFICAAANYCETTVELLPSKSGVETGVPMSPSLKQDCVRAVRQHTMTIADFLICRRIGSLIDLYCVQVLTWREHPQDLDLHCLTSNCHVYVIFRTCLSAHVKFENYLASPVTLRVQVSREQQLPRRQRCPGEGREVCCVHH